MDLDLKPVLTPVRDIGDFIREQRLAAQISLRGLAARAGVSNPYLSQVERGLRRPSAEILTQIAHGLSISVETLLAKAGILDVPHAPEVIAAIRADPVLTERHKSVLVEVYTALRGQALAAAQPLASAGDGPGAEPDVDRPDAEPDADRTGPEPDVDRTDAAPEPAHAAATGRVPDVVPLIPTGIDMVPEGAQHEDH
jgi:transcriptional regulator with XRE-family HTH domain